MQGKIPFSDPGKEMWAPGRTSQLHKDMNTTLYDHITWMIANGIMENPELW